MLIGLAGIITVETTCRWIANHILRKDKTTPPSPGVLARRPVSIGGQTNPNLKGGRIAGVSYISIGHQCSERALSYHLPWCSSESVLFALGAPRNPAKPTQAARVCSVQVFSRKLLFGRGGKEGGGRGTESRLLST